MSANLGNTQTGSQEVELNITSIVDCFTVLITFMLASASFLSIGFFEAATAGPEKENREEGKETPPPVEITVTLRKDFAYLVKVTGKASRERRLEAASGAWNHDALAAELASLKKTWPTVTSVALLAENGVTYKSVIEAMDRIRKQLPHVLLGEL